MATAFLAWDWPSYAEGVPDVGVGASPGDGPSWVVCRRTRPDGSQALVATVAADVTIRQRPADVSVLAFETDDESIRDLLLSERLNDSAVPSVLSLDGQTYPAACTRLGYLWLWRLSAPDGRPLAVLGPAEAVPELVHVDDRLVSAQE